MIWNNYESQINSLYQNTWEAVKKRHQKLGKYHSNLILKCYLGKLDLKELKRINWRQIVDKNGKLMIIRDMKILSYNESKDNFNDNKSSTFARRVFSHEYNRILSQNKTLNNNSRLNTSFMNRNNNLLSGRKPLVMMDFKKPINQIKESHIPNALLKNRYFSPPVMHKNELGITSPKDSVNSGRVANWNFTADRAFRAHKVSNTEAITSKVNQMKNQYLMTNNSMFPVVSKKDCYSK